MELQISYHPYTPILQKDNIAADIEGYRVNHSHIMRTEGSGEIIEAAAMPDHIHLYVAIPPKYAVSDFTGYFKGKSSLKEFKDPFTGEPIGKGK